MEHRSLPTADQVKLAVERYAGITHLGRVRDLSNTDQLIESPDPTAYALGWIIANAIIQHRYASSGIDVIPIYHPETGWDRFLISRRTACTHRSHESADRFGMLQLRNNGSVQLVNQDGTPQLDIGDRLQCTPDAAIEDVLEHIPDPGLGSGDHEQCWHSRASATYPLLYDVISQLVVTHPGLIAAREIYIDAAKTERGFHPLYVHTGGQITGFNYDWFAVESGAGLVYVRLHARGIVYQTERGTWRSEALPTSELSWATLRERLLTWLRIEPAVSPPAP